MVDHFFNMKIAVNFRFVKYQWREKFNAVDPKKVDNIPIWTT